MGQNDGAPASGTGSGFDPSRERRMEWSVEHGQVSLTYPDGITEADTNDVEELFALALRMMRRRAAERDSDGSRNGGDGGAGSVACDDSAGPKDIAETPSEDTP